VKHSGIKIKVLERLEAEVTVSGSTITAFRLAGVVMGKCDEASPSGTILRLSLTNSAQPAQLGDAVCNGSLVPRLEGRAEEQKNGEVGIKRFGLTFKFDGEVLLSPEDLVMYRTVPAFRPLLLLARCSLLADSSSGSETESKAKLRVELELNKNFFPARKIANLEVKVLLTKLLKVGGFSVAEAKSPLPHTLSGAEREVIGWVLQNPDRKEMKMTFEAILLLRRSVDAISELQPSPSSLPVRVSLVLPEHLISATEVTAAVEQTSVLYSSNLNIIFNP
jgi:hypothetical protein